MADGDPSGKAAWRARALGRRATLSADERLSTALHLRQAAFPLAGATVAVYASAGSEPGTGPLLAALAGRCRVLLPVLLPDDDLDWAEYRPNEARPGPAGSTAGGTPTDTALHPVEGLLAGRRGLLEPGGSRLGCSAVAACSLVLVPALAVDLTGGRLGRGGGSYDRALQRARGLVVAALHPGELVQALPLAPHDRPVEAAVLPGQGLVRLGSAVGRPGGP